MTHNGTDMRLPTQLTITFDKPVTGITADRFSVSNATRGALTQSEENTNVYYLELSNVTQPNSYSISTEIMVYMNYMSSYTFIPNSKSITIEMLKYEDWEYWINTDNTITLTKYIGYDTDVEIPAIVSGRTVTKLERTFDNYKSLKSAIIPDVVVEIAGTFSGCSNLTNVIIPNSVTSIGNYAFGYCTSLTEITIPDSVTSIGRGAFSGCGLTSVTIPSSVIFIDGNDYVPNGAFNNCNNLTSVTLSDGLISIGTGAFYSCYNLTSITIPDSVTSIGRGAFSGCYNLKSVPMGNGVTTIGVGAFDRCGLTSITIPDSATSIGTGAFLYCRSLKSVTIPESVTSIGNNAFSECTELSTAYFQHSDSSTITDFGQDVFYNTAADFKIYYPANATGFTTPTWKGVPAYPTDYIAVTSISLNMNAETMQIGDSVTLTATVAPDNATNKDVTWSSSNPSVAVVDADGTVTAVSIGAATITAKTADNRTAVCTITVEMSTPEINDIKITVQPETKAKRIYEVFGAGTVIADKDEMPLNSNDNVGTGSVITLPNGNKLTIVVPGDLTGKGKPPQMEDAKIYLEALVGNAVLSDAQESALEDIVIESDSAIKKLRSFLNFVK